MSAFQPGGMYPAANSNLGGTNPYAAMYRAMLSGTRRQQRPSAIDVTGATPEQIAQANTQWDSGNADAFNDIGQGGNQGIADFEQKSPYAGLFSYGGQGATGTNAPAGATSPAAGGGGGAYGSQYGGGAAFAANPGAGGLAAGGGAVGSHSLGAPGGGSGLDSSLDSGYSKLINSGGKLFDDPTEAGIVNRAQSAVAQGGQDALEGANADALARGDTTGATAATDRGRIRGQTAADEGTIAAQTKIGLGQADRQSLLAALGGGTGLMQARGNLALGQGELSLKGQEFGLQQLQALEAMFGGGGVKGTSNGMTPEMLAAFANQGA